MTRPKRVVVAISGASGPIYGIRLLEVLRRVGGVETHAVVSAGARATIAYETKWKLEDVLALADVVHDEKDLAAPIASGSFLTDGMVVAPCSVRTLGDIATSHNDNLIVRAADVHLKERRKLVLMVRETPLHAGHLKAMYDLSLYGAVILPPVAAFYHLPTTIDDLVDHSVGKALDQLGVEHELFRRWTGPLSAEERKKRT
ncbi:MAG: UbiX family flavin prenyltransferase [Chloroflexota bacterium]|nr:UbiX family flavin prenyltransferase [Chloroflexota bacterium]MDE3193083.1 UbiX family flavin prenyltransferase [Chloroflexota bacterium]